MRLYSIPAQALGRSSRICGVKLPFLPAVFRLFLVVVAALVIGVCATRSVMAQQTNQRVVLDTLPGHGLDSATDLGPLDASKSLQLTLTLAQTPERQAALDRLLGDLMAPASPGYRKWLTPSAFAAHFGATAAQVAALTDWATGQGLTVQSWSPSGTRVVVSGLRPQIESAFHVSIHRVRLGGNLYFANVDQPALDADSAALIAGIEGLDDLPKVSLAATGLRVDANRTTVLIFEDAAVDSELSASIVAGFRAMFRQAEAQGITVLVAANSGVPSDLVSATSVARVGADAPNRPSAEERPNWQVAPGLPSSTFRQYPDLTASSLSLFAATLESIASTVPGGRLGNINPILYQLAPKPGIFHQSDSTVAGTWEPASGLGLIDLEAFAMAFPGGTGKSFASLSLSNYSPVHGQNVTFTTMVTSGTGGATPSGTVSFMTSTGAALGTAPITGGTATFTTNTIAGGSYTVTANYSGDSTYASATSASGTLFVQPEPSQLAAVISTGNVVGGSYSVAVTDTAGSGVGIPSGNVAVTLSGTSTSYTQTLAPAGANSSSATFAIPATTVGTLTLSINCTGDLSFSCYNALTKTVTIAKATPVLNFSYSPSPVVSGATLTLNATLAPVGTAPAPSGSVTFYDGITVLNAGALTNGSTSVTGIVPTTATHSLTAVYNGDADYNTANATGAPVSTTSATLSATISSASAVAGTTVTVTGTVTLSGASPSGTVLAQVNSANGGTTNYTATLNATGATTASFSIPISVPVTAGTYSVGVGCASADAFTCNSVTLGLTSTAAATGKVATTTILTLTPASPVAGAATTLTATITPASAGSATPTGTVSFYDGTTLIGTAPVSAGSATTPTILSGTSSHSLTAVYSGDADYATSTSAAVAVNFALQPDTVTLSVNSSGVAGGNVTLTATVNTLPSAVSATGQVSFYLSGTVPSLLGAATLSPTGPGLASASLTTAFVPSGAQTVYAVYAGDSVFSAGTSQTAGLGLTDYSVIFDPAAISLTAGDTGNVNVQVIGTGGFAGSVAFTCIPPVGVLISCSITPANVLSGGSATLTITTTAARLKAQNDWRSAGLLGGVSIAALLCCCFPMGKCRKRLPGMLLILLAIGLMTNAGCSSSVSGTPASGGTPLGTVYLTIDSASTGASGSVNHDYSYQVTVQ